MSFVHMHKRRRYTLLDNSNNQLRHSTPEAKLCTLYVMPLFSKNIKEENMNQRSVTGEIKTEVTASDRANIARLIDDYRLYEGVDFLVSLEEMLAPSGNTPAHLLHYQGDTLTGFAYLQHLR